MKLLNLTMASLVGVQAVPGYTDCDTARDNLCEFDVKTGLRKQCVKRYVASISNTRDSDYKNLKKLDPDLVKGRETFSCYTQGAEVDTVLALYNKKDRTTTVTLQYTALDIPAGTAYADPLPEATTPE